MSGATVALLGTQALLGLVGLGAGGAKVTSQESQVAEFRRFEYPQWFRVGTGIVEILAGIGLLAGLLWRPELGWAGGLLLAGVLAGAVVTHVRTGDPPSKTVVPVALLAITAGLLAVRYAAPV